jgi:hypothetical protein
MPSCPSGPVLKVPSDPIKNDGGRVPGAAAWSSENPADERRVLAKLGEYAGAFREKKRGSS